MMATQIEPCRMWSTESGEALEGGRDISLENELDSER